MRIFISRIKRGIISVVQAFKVQVLVIGQFRMKAHHGSYPHIGTHCRNAAEFYAKIGIAAVSIHIALAETQPAQMVASEDCAKFIDDLHSGFYLAGRFLVTVFESIFSQIHDFRESALNHMQFFHCRL